MEKRIGTPVHAIKENELEKHYNRTLVDANGNLLTVTLNKIVNKRGTFWSSIVQPEIVVEFGLKPNGLQITIDELKQLILTRKDELFHITVNKLMTVNEFVQKVNGAQDFKELIEIASFGLD